MKSGGHSGAGSQEEFASPTDADCHRGHVPVTQWDGHGRRTREVLAGLLTRCADQTAPRLTRGERVLFTAGEFWAAAMAGTIRTHLGQAPEGVLALAEQAFVEVGALRVATTLRVARINLVYANPPISHATIASAIESALAITHDRVDDLLARFANEQTWERL